MHYIVKVDFKDGRKNIYICDKIYCDIASLKPKLYLVVEDWLCLHEPFENIQEFYTLSSGDGYEIKGE